MCLWADMVIPALPEEAPSPPSGDSPPPPLPNSPPCNVREREHEQPPIYYCLAQWDKSSQCEWEDRTMCPDKQGEKVS